MGRKDSPGSKWDKVFKEVPLSVIDNACQQTGHNDCGVHGACPLEVLHWISLGQYKYIRGMFFFQTGKEVIHEPVTKQADRKKNQPDPRQQKVSIAHLTIDGKLN